MRPEREVVAGVWPKSGQSHRRRVTKRRAAHFLLLSFQPGMPKAQVNMGKSHGAGCAPQTSEFVPLQQFPCQEAHLGAKAGAGPRSRTNVMNRPVIAARKP